MHGTTGGLAFEGVSHAFGPKVVVDDVTIAVPAGALTCLLGPSGCGKTTLLRLAAGLEPLRQGRILIGGAVVADGATRVAVPPERRNVGLMFQDYALFPHLTLRQNVAFGLAGRNDDRRAWVDEAIRRIGLDGLADKYPHTLSGGQQQRAALLRALAPQPGVLLLDEPFSGLDVTRRAQIREDTLALLRDSGVATLMVTHDPEEAMFMADRLMVMDGGRVVQAGPPEEIYFKPASAYVAGLFGKVNRLTGTARDGRVDTAVGPVPARGIGDGTAVEVLIRPEGLAVLPAEAVHGTPARTRFARLLGRSSHVHVAIAGDPPVEMEARVRDVYLPADGTEVRVELDPRQAFVFPLA
ncbi:MAG: ABC transporter ATP-binding protein [Hyphomicrobiales bacterium]|nr:ABC transporter ATP-binding protein [Hyphomicrobiales bacterium]MCP5373625.1 ABC transporter ATP-binding protein [Hyphomicrobiales bacterium]